MENSALIMIGLFTVMVIAIVLMAIIIIRISGKSGSGGISDMRREMRYEIDRSRQDTLEMVQSSFRELGSMISQN